jgi:soluble lytic murein transglycosylase-like protein
MPARAHRGRSELRRRLAHAALLWAPLLASGCLGSTGVPAPAPSPPAPSGHRQPASRPAPASQPAAAAAPATHPASSPYGPGPYPETAVLVAFGATQRERYDQEILGAAIRWSVDPFLLKGLLFSESRFQARRVNRRTGAAGIAQFTARGRRGMTQLRSRRGDKSGFSLSKALDPKHAIPAAAELLALFSKRYGRDGGVAAYNAGPRAGILVRDLGFWPARPRVGPFLLVVLRHTNRYRTAAGLPPLPLPPVPASQPATEPAR